MNQVIVDADALWFWTKSITFNHTIMVKPFVLLDISGQAQAWIMVDNEKTIFRWVNIQFHEIGTREEGTRISSKRMLRKYSGIINKSGNTQSHLCEQR